MMRGGRLGVLARRFSTSQQPSLTVREKVRSLVALRKSVMPYVSLDDGCPVFGLYQNERHQGNLKDYNKGSLVVYPITPANINPTNFAIPRANLTGIVEPLEDAELFGIDKLFRSRHPGSVDVIAQFHWYKLTPSEVIFAGDGYSVSNTLTFEEYATAVIDPVVASSRSLLEELNGDRLVDVARLCKTHGGRGVDEVFVFGVDKYGFDAMGWAQEDDSWQAYRFSFAAAQKNVDAARNTLNGLLSE